MQSCCYFNRLAGSNEKEKTSNHRSLSSKTGSGYYTLTRESLKTASLLRVFFTIVLLPFLLLIKQPDLGTAVVVFLIFASMSLAKGLQKKLMVILLLISFVSLPFVGNILWTGLKDYQKNRLVAFIDPKADPTGIGYHINQSKIAIGSGGFTGKGFLQGTQGPFRFLPEKHTDFLFSAFAEEWGFLGCSLLLTLYFILLMNGLDTARKAKDDFAIFVVLMTGTFAIAEYTATSVSEFPYFQLGCLIVGGMTIISLKHKYQKIYTGELMGVFTMYTILIALFTAPVFNAIKALVS